MNGNRIKNALAVGLALVAGGLFAQAPVTISYMNFSGAGDMSPNLTKMKEAFEKRNPGIKVNIETFAYADYFTQLQTRAAAGKLSDAFELNYENFVAYAKRGALLDLASVGADTKGLAPKAVEAFAYAGKQYGLPESFSTVLLFYNQALFDRAKVGYPNSDWTWKDVQAAAEKIRALDKTIYGIYQPVQFWEFYKLVKQNGGSLVSADNKKFTVNSPANVATLTNIVERYTKSNVSPTSAQMGGVGDWDLFKSGRLGMIVTGIWAFNEFIRDCDFPWDVAVEPGNTARATHFFSNGIVVSKTAKNAKAAAAWAQFMASSNEAANIRLDASWELPAVTSPEIMAKYTKAPVPASRWAVYESLNYLVTPVVIDQNQEMVDILNQQLTAAKEGTKTPAQALSDAQKDLASKIKL
jgi:multiple sugar transport system substrate-binding protein